MGRMIRFVILAATLAACGVSAPEQSAPSATQPVRMEGVPPPPGQTATQPAHPGACDVKAGDSAYAVCWATRPDAVDGPPRPVSEIVRLGDTLCIITMPGETRAADGTAIVALDGMRRTRVLHTAVVENIESDSIGCR